MMNPKKEPSLPPQNNQKEKNDKVKVILRVRPFLETQDPDCFISPQPNHSISINKPGMTSFMKFSHVQHESNHVEKGQSQKDIFLAVEQAVKCIFQGHDSTVFAYGQTGAGKTYTIIGNCPQNNSDDDFYKTTLCNFERGILPRSLELIFQEQRKKRNSRITISFFELYNEKIFDLLAGGQKPLDLRESKGEITIVGLSAIEVISIKEAINYLAGGVKNRSTSSTSVNIKSSRSHSIFHLKYEQLILNPDTKEHDVMISHLRVVDLAGSEKFNISPDLSQAEKELRLLELRSINGSLSKLGHCISALTIQSRTHIPVRDSKLTRILSQSLLGTGRIRLIICISPSFSSMMQTSSTLLFADRVKKAIFQRPTTPNTEKKRFVDYEEFESLQEELEQERQKRQELQKIVAAMKVNPGQFTLVKENQKLKQEIQSLKEQLKVYANQDKLSSSRRKKAPSPLPSYSSKSLSPKPNNIKSNIPAKVNNGLKTKSIAILKQDLNVGGKMTNTPPKKEGPKSSKDYDSKSQRMSVDEPQRVKQNSKFRKEGRFDNKVKLFMEKPEYDCELEEKVKKKLLEISTFLVIKKNKFQWGVVNGWRVMIQQMKPYGNDAAFKCTMNFGDCFGFSVDSKTLLRLPFCLEAQDNDKEDESRKTSL